MSILIYFLIFSEKIIENLLSSFRAIVYTAGYKHVSALITIIVALIWLFVASAVIIDINTDPLKLVSFILGQVIGIYFGTTIEEKIALGNSLLYIIIDKKYLKIISDSLREKGFGVTSVNAKGYKSNEKTLLLILCKRKRKNEILEITKSFDKNSVILVKKPTKIKGSYILE